MAAIAKNNAFGAGSPSWNLSFPEGNLTVSEILAYLPHWLKSVDVILRLVNHGGRSVVITHLLNMYRNMPTSDYAPNSTTVMMHYAMRRAGKPGWTIGTRGNFRNDRDYDENSVYVGDFRPPRLTHPKSASSKQKVKKTRLARNWAAEPIPFKHLARHVKEHPSGDDALDLTRCVAYALKNPDEVWMFPDDFAQLVEHLGGPVTVTHSHLDRQLFKRYDHLYTAHDPARPPTNWNKSRKSKTKKRKIEDTESETESSDNNSEGDSEISENTRVKIESKVKRRKTSNKPSTDKTVTRKAQNNTMAETSSSTNGKPTSGQLDGSHDGDGKRRSSRRVMKAPDYTEKDEDATVRCNRPLSVAEAAC